MGDLRRLGAAAIVVLVLLRVSIGWQFLYEGLWKLQSQNTTRPWTAEGYLKNAVGPLRPVFQDLAGGDPHDLRWLDYDDVAGRWDAWHERFLRHHPDLTDDQRQELARLLNGPDAFEAPLPALPAGVRFDGSLGKIIRYDAERKRLVLDGRARLLPAEHSRLRGMVRVEPNPPEERLRKNVLAAHFQRAVDLLYREAQQLSFKERLRASLKGDPERVGAKFVRLDRTGAVQEWARGQQPEGPSDDELTILEARPGRIDFYRASVERYEDALARAQQDFERVHLERVRQELGELRNELVGPVLALDNELKLRALEVLEPQQLARGPAPPALTMLRFVDLSTMWSLTILGLLLMIGLASRVAALGGAVLVLMFYLAMPPWPGVPEVPGPEHSLIVNKNLIEVIALVAIALLPTGTWFGLDGIFTRLWRGRSLRQSGAARPAEPAPAPKGSANEAPASAAAGGG